MREQRPTVETDLSASPAPTATRRRRAGIAVGLLTPLVVAFASGLAMPHGPATTFQALVVIGSSLVVGILSGWGLASRWAILAAPLLYVAAYELARLDAVGPTVDAPRFDELYGILALALGRGVHGVLALLPMMLGAAIGAGISRRPPATGQRHSRPRLRATWIIGLLLVGTLAVVVAMPPSTPPILGADGRPEEGALTDLVDVRLGGVDQRILVRARDAGKPVLLWLAGGPGQTDPGA